MDIQNAHVERLVYEPNISVHDSTKSPNTSVASPRDATIEEDTVHQVIKPMEIDKAIKKYQTQNKKKKE